MPINAESTTDAISMEVIDTYENVASGNYSSVSGGAANTASGIGSSASGGRVSMATGLFSSVSGGWNNTADGTNSSVSGGFCNEPDIGFINFCLSDADCPNLPNPVPGFPDCIPLDLFPDAIPDTVGELINILAGQIQFGACQEAADLAAAINEGGGLAGGGSSVDTGPFELEPLSGPRPLPPKREGKRPRR